MTLTITYPHTGSRTHVGLTQSEVNRIITMVSTMNDAAPVPRLTIRVEALVVKPASTTLTQSMP